MGTFVFSILYIESSILDSLRKNDGRLLDSEPCGALLRRRGEVYNSYERHMTVKCPSFRRTVKNARAPFVRLLG